MVQLILHWMSFHTCKPEKIISNSDYSYVTKIIFFKKIYILEEMSMALLQQIVGKLFRGPKIISKFPKLIG